MTIPAGYVSRPATWNDLEDVVALFKTCDLADAGLEDPVREHLEDDWRRTAFELERHTRLVVAPGDELAAYADVFGFNPQLSMDAHARVHPGHRERGLGSWLVEWTEARATEFVPDGVASMIRNGVPAGDEEARALLLARGYEQVRTFWHMERELSDDVEPGLAPTGIEIRDYRHDAEADAVYDAVEEAFMDHWAWERYPPRDLHMEEIRRLDPALVGVALDGDEIAGVLMMRTIEGAGWIDIVAVRRPWRGRGIARALLRRAFAILGERGARTAMLNVDSSNPTGATRLYESVGMRVRRAWNVFGKPLPADIS